MKKLYISLLFLISANYFPQVTFYINPQLQAQVTANHAMRITNEALIRDKYASMKDKYEKVNEKIAQILVIKQQLHSYLTNVHSLISNGRQLRRTYADLSQLYVHLTRLSQLSAQYPEYAVWCTPTFNKIFTKSLECQNYITSIILKEDPRYLMDMHNRTLFLSKIQQEIRHLNLLAYSVVLYIENAKSIPYWRNVPELNLWVNHDKAMIEQIIQQAGWF